MCLLLVLSRLCTLNLLWTAPGEAGSEFIDGVAAGLGERAMELMAQRARSRVAFGKPIAEQSSFVKELAGHRVQLDAARCAHSGTADAGDCSLHSDNIPHRQYRHFDTAPSRPFLQIWSTSLLQDSSRATKAVLRPGSSWVRPGVDWGPCACRWTVLAAAEALDRVGAKDARGQIAAAKVKPCRHIAKWKFPY